MAEKLHYLFVCHANMDRSPTAEAVCERIAAEDGLDIIILPLSWTSG
jgi:protein-tyrosine-phosphatase